MLKALLLHPEILAALAGAGHGSRVLIADGNSPFSTCCLPETPVVYLNLRPGLVSVIDVLEILLSAIPVESALVMVPPEGPNPEIHSDFRKMLPAEVPIVRRRRREFYDEVRSNDTALVIATGEQRVWANIMLTIGVVKPA